MSHSTVREKKQFFMYSLIAWFFVFMYSVFQKIGIDPLVGQYQTRLSSHRIFSTLGNPNYLAGYALMMLPLGRIALQSVRDHVARIISEIFLWLSVAMTLFWTGSYLAWVILPMYTAVLIVRYSVRDLHMQRRIFFGSFCVFVLVAIFIFYTY